MSETMARRELEYIQVLKKHACDRIKDLRSKHSEPSPEKNAEIERMVKRVKLDLIQIIDRELQLCKAIPEWQRKLMLLGTHRV